MIKYEKLFIDNSFCSTTFFCSRLEAIIKSIELENINSQTSRTIVCWSRSSSNGWNQIQNSGVRRNGWLNSNFAYPFHRGSFLHNHSNLLLLYSLLQGWRCPGESQSSQGQRGRGKGFNDGRWWNGHERRKNGVKFWLVIINI